MDHLLALCLDIKLLGTRKGGLISLTGTDDVRKIRSELIPTGDWMARLALDAMEYTIVKWAYMMAGALKGRVDAVLMTGGLAYDKELVEQLTADLSWIAPAHVYPGSYETEALAAGTIRVLAARRRPGAIPAGRCGRGLRLNRGRAENMP